MESLECSGDRRLTAVCFDAVRSSGKYMLQVHYWKPTWALLYPCPIAVTHAHYEEYVGAYRMQSTFPRKVSFRAIHLISSKEYLLLCHKHHPKEPKE